MKPWVRWQDWANVALGAWLFFSPWMFNYGGDAANNAWLFGAIAVAVGFWALARPGSRGAEWTNVALGTWMFFAPWVVGFGATNTAGAFNAWIIGGAIAILAGTGLSNISTRAPHHA